jgi:membrane fusion protein, heavy metal efflux system
MSTVAAPISKPRLRRVHLVLGVVIIAVMAVGVRWVMKAPAPPAKADRNEERSTPYLDGAYIRFPPAFARREQLTFAPAVAQELTPTVSVTGHVVYDARRVAVVGARISGRIRSVFKVEGDQVQPGEVLAELESAELGKAQAEVLKARAKEYVAKLDEARERRLADANVSAERDAQHAKATAEASSAERLAAEKAVAALGGTVDGEVGVLRLKSSIAGQAIETHVRRGATVEPKDTLFVVADLKKVWVEFSVFERELPAVRVGDVVTMSLPSDSSQKFEGVVAHVGHVIDLTNRNAMVRVELDNEKQLLRPGLSMVGQIRASGPRETRLVVPKEAVARVDGKPTVFVEVSEGVVEPRALSLGPDDDNHVSVLEGLKANERVVVNGVLTLKAELFR